MQLQASESQQDSQHQQVGLSCMRCYYVFIHGRLTWIAKPPSDEVLRPEGFYCHRYVFARNSHKAAEIAVERVNRTFRQSNDWIKNHQAALRLEVDEVSRASPFNVFRRGNRGHVFYGRA